MSCFDESSRAATAAIAAATAAIAAAKAAAVELYSDLRLDNTLCEHTRTCTQTEFTRRNLSYFDDLD
jgi:hypothetical protein